MSTLQICCKLSTKQIEVQELGDTISAGFTKIGEILRTSPADYLGLNGFQVGHDKTTVLFHHIRRALYDQFSATANPAYQDPSKFTVIVDVTYTPLTALAISPTTATKVHGQTQQLTPAFTPSGATDQRVTYVSSNPAVATVDVNGLVTTIIAGSATITATSDEGDFTGTCVITST